jgi:hypothetical protein
MPHVDKLSLNELTEASDGPESRIQEQLNQRDNQRHVIHPILTLDDDCRNGKKSGCIRYLP